VHATIVVSNRSTLTNELDFKLQISNSTGSTIARSRKTILCIARLLQSMDDKYALAKSAFSEQRLTAELFMISGSTYAKSFEICYLSAYSARGMEIFSIAQVLPVSFRRFGRSLRASLGHLLCPLLAFLLLLLCQELLVGSSLRFGF